MYGYVCHVWLCMSWSVDRGRLIVVGRACHVWLCMSCVGGACHVWSCMSCVGGACHGRLIMVG